MGRQKGFGQGKMGPMEVQLAGWIEEEGRLGWLGCLSRANGDWMGLVSQKVLDEDDGWQQLVGLELML